MILLLWTYWGHSRKKVTTTQIHQKIFSELFLGKPKESFVHLLNEFVKTKGEDFFYPPALSQLQQAYIRGDSVAICSSSPDFIVECFANYLKVKLWCGSKYHVDKQGNFIVISAPIQAEEKVSYLLSLRQLFSINKEQTIAYSDSIRDLKFLEAAGKAMGVQPDKELRQVCLQRRWEILK